MKRLLLSVFSIGLILSFAPVRAESKMLNWTKEQLCNVQWGQGAQAVAGDAKAVGSFVYSQLPSKEAMKNAAVAGGVMAKDGAQKAFAFGKSQLPSQEAVKAAAIAGKDVAIQALSSVKSFAFANPGKLFIAGVSGMIASASYASSLEQDFTLPVDERMERANRIVKYAFLPSFALACVAGIIAKK